LTGPAEKQTDIIRTLKTSMETLTVLESIPVTPDVRATYLVEMRVTPLWVKRLNQKTSFEAVKAELDHRLNGKITAFRAMNEKTGKMAAETWGDLDPLSITMANANPTFTVGIDLRRLAEVRAAPNRSVFVRGLPKETPFETIEMQARVDKVKVMAPQLAKVDAVYPLPEKEPWSKCEGFAVLQMATAEDVNRLVEEHIVKDNMGRTLIFQEWFPNVGQKKAAKVQMPPPKHQEPEPEPEDEFADVIQRLKPRKAARSPVGADAMQK